MALDNSLNGVAALVAVFLFLTTGTVLLRFVARRKQRVLPWVDDYMALAAWVGFVGMASLVSYGMGHRFVGYHEPKDKAIVNAQHPTMEQVFLSLDALEVWTFGTTKLAALLFYRRIFCTIPRRDVFHYVTWIFTFVVAAWIVTFVVMTFNLCGSHHFPWQLQPGNFAKCKLDYPYFEAFSISDFILDVFVFGLAFPKIWSLRLTNGQKIAASCVFLLALGGIGASTTRMVIYIHIVRTGRAANDEDGYQTNTQMAYYALLEGGLSLVCVNLPSVWYFVAGIKPERVLRSVRSLVSLRSNFSEPNKTDSTFSTGRNNSSAPLDRDDLQRRNARSHEPTKGIRVQHSVEIRHQMSDTSMGGSSNGFTKESI